MLTVAGQGAAASGFSMGSWICYKCVAGIGGACVHCGELPHRWQFKLWSLGAEELGVPDDVMVMMDFDLNRDVSVVTPSS